LKIVADLFDTAYCLTKNDTLLPFAKTMFASLLQYLNDVIRDCGTANTIISHIVKSSMKFGITLKVLIAWGNIVRDDFALRNASRVPYTDNSYVAHVATALQKEVIALREENRKMQSDMKNQSAMLMELIQLLRDQAISGDPHTPQSKNKRLRVREVYLYYNAV
jgi:hypothetical protein